MDPDDVLAAYKGWVNILEQATPPTRTGGSIAKAVRAAAYRLVKNLDLIEAHDPETSAKIHSLLSKAAGEPETSICVGIFVSAESGNKACRYSTALGTHCKKHLKTQGIAQYLNGDATLAGKTCVACDLAPSAENPLLKCVCCPIVWHKDCILSWLQATGSADAMNLLNDGAALQCSRCSYFKYGWPLFLGEATADGAATTLAEDLAEVPGPASPCSNLGQTSLVGVLRSKAVRLVTFRMELPVGSRITSLSLSRSTIIYF